MVDEKWDFRFLELAEVIAKWSKDGSTKVGAIIVRPDRTIASTGFNGFARGMDDFPDLYANRDYKYPRIIHAEMNALNFRREDVSGYTLYSSLHPCLTCASNIIQAGIKRVVCPLPDERVLERWGDNFALAMHDMQKAGIQFDVYGI